MRITSIRELSVPLQGNIANALVNFAKHTVSLVAVVSDVIRNGKPLTGYAFDSIGRYAQGGLLRERFIPRLMRARPEELLDDTGTHFDPARVLAIAMKDEKPGGHGDRAAAVGALELACWDLNAKFVDEPAWMTIARHFGREPQSCGVPVYAAGGYYHPPGSSRSLGDELRAYREQGYGVFKMKIGGATLAEDLARIEEALAVAGEGRNLSVDANGRFDLETALEYSQAMSPYALRWFEEAGDPLDFDLNRRLAEACDAPIATGENLFSLPDLRNLVQFGGMRRRKDIFQMDPGLAYGLVEYGRMLALLEQHGYERRFAHPHGGHMINLHIAAGLELGGCESYPGVFQPIGGYAPGCGLAGGRIHATDAPGFGLEEKPELHAMLRQLAR